MKIIYVNGFKTENKSSSTYFYLKENLKDVEVVECRWWCENGKIDYENIINSLKKESPNIIVASSTGGLIVSQLAEVQILINPVINRKDLEILFPFCDFSNFPSQAEKQKNQTIIVGKNDEILNPNKTIEFFQEENIIEVEDNHRLENKEIILEAVKNYY